MAYTQQQLDDLKSAYASGASKIKHNNKETEFRSREDMKKLIIEMEADLLQTTNGNRHFYPKFSKGYM